MMKLPPHAAHIAFLLIFITLCRCDKPTAPPHIAYSSAVFKAKDYLKDRYFFLDNTYRRYYIRKYAPQGLNPAPPPRVMTLSVWRSFDRMVTENRSNIRIVRVDSIDQLYRYERLERDHHYYLDDAEGYIRFSDSICLQPQQQVAIFMRTGDSTQYPQLQKGRMEDTVMTDSSGEVLDTIWTLWTIRPMVPIDSAEADTSRFHLMWRHVYGYVDFSHPASFKIRVNRIRDDDLLPAVKAPNGSYYSDILNLTENNVPLIQNTRIFDRLFYNLVLPPFDTTDAGLDAFNNPALGEYRDSVIYRYAETHLRRKESEGYKSIYKIEMSCEIEMPDSE